MPRCTVLPISSPMSTSCRQQRYVRPTKRSWRKWSTRLHPLNPSPPCSPPFARVTTSSWSGLFHCYNQTDLPRTNNELEHYFGSARYHERRASGRKQASPGVVVRGSVLVVASVASHLHPFSGAELCPTDLTRWHALHSELNHRYEARRMQYRFRKSPERYLVALEEKLSKQRLPT